MIKKIKNLLRIEDLIHELAEETEKQSREIKKLASEVAALKSEIRGHLSEIRTASRTYTKVAADFSELIGKIKSDTAKLHQAINEFSMQKSGAVQKIIEKLRTDITHFTDNLRTDVHAFDRLKREVDGITVNLEKAKVEIKRFSEISAKLKSSDFELTRYIRQVQEMDREKLQLLRKIDSLERIIATERRRKR